MAGEIVGRAHRLADPARQHGGVERLVDAVLDDGEFVAADARHGVAVAHAMAKPAAHHLEQLVAHRMAERIVDALEAVEVEVKHGKLVAAVDAGQRVGEPLAKQQPVGQVGQRVVPRHVGDALLGLAAFGDVVVGGDEAAVAHGMIEHRDGAPVRQLDQLGEGGAGGQRLVQLADIGVDIAAEPAIGLAVLEQFAERAARLHGVAGEPVHPHIALVADHQTAVAVEHQQRLRHVVDGGLEAQVLRLELALALAQRLGAHGDEFLQPAVERVRAPRSSMRSSGRCGGGRGRACS